VAFSFAAATLESVDAFKLLFSSEVHGMVTTFFNTVTSCFIRPTLSSEKLLNSVRSWLYLELKSVQLDTGPTVVEAACLFILALPDDVDGDADADVVDVVLREA